MSNEKLAIARRIMEPFLARLLMMPELQAAYILSSSAQACSNPTEFDDQSDFDVAIVLDIPMRPNEWRPQQDNTYQLLAGRIPDWVPNFLFHVPVPWGEMEINVHQLIFQYEADQRTAWTGDKCDVYLNKSETLLDHDSCFGQLVEQKAAAGHAVLMREQERLANRITWDVREMPLRQAHRLGPEGGHYVFNMALDEVVDYIYAAAGQFIPNRKWKLPQLQQRSLLTSEQGATLCEAMRCDPSSMVDLERRINALEQLYDSLPELASTGPAISSIRKRFQSTIQLRPDTYADLVSAHAPAPLVQPVYDLVNYQLCGSSADLAATLSSESLPGALQAVAPQIKDQLQPILDGGLVDVDLRS